MIESSRKQEPIPDNYAGSSSSNRRHGNFFHKSIYGSCYGNDIAWAQASAVQNTWYEIADTDMTDGQLSGVAHDGSGKLTVSVAGVYLINWTVSMECSGVNKHVQTAVSVSGTESMAGVMHHETAVPDEQFVVAGTAILPLAANDTVEISVRTTDTGTPNLTVDHLAFTVLQVAV